MIRGRFSLRSFEPDCEHGKAFTQPAQDIRELLGNEKNKEQRKEQNYLTAPEREKAEHQSRFRTNRHGKPVPTVEQSSALGKKYRSLLATHFRRLDPAKVR